MPCMKHTWYSQKLEMEETIELARRVTSAVEAEYRASLEEWKRAKGEVQDPAGGARGERTALLQERAELVQRLRTIDLQLAQLREAAAPRKVRFTEANRRLTEVKKRRSRLQAKLKETAQQQRRLLAAPPIAPLAEELVSWADEAPAPAPGPAPARQELEEALAGLDAARGKVELRGDW